MSLSRLFSVVTLVAALAAAPGLHATLADAPESVQPLAKGTAAPSAVITGLDGKAVELSSVTAGKPTVLIFYRGGWCPFCNRHLAALGETYLELRKLGYQIVAVTPDDLTALAATIKEQQVRYKLFSDRGMALSERYGIAYRIGAETAKAYKENGIELAPAPGTKDFWLPVPSAFVIGAQGTIKFVYHNPDPSVRISSEELLAAAKAALN